MKTEIFKEQKWLHNTQKRISKLICNPYWDEISVSENYLIIINEIINAKDVNMLSPVIDEYLVDYVLAKVEKQLNIVKNKSKTK